MFYKNDDPNVRYYPPEGGPGYWIARLADQGEHIAGYISEFELSMGLANGTVAPVPGLRTWVTPEDFLARAEEVVRGHPYLSTSVAQRCREFAAMLARTPLWPTPDVMADYPFVMRVAVANMLVRVAKEGGPQ